MPCAAWPSASSPLQPEPARAHAPTFGVEGQENPPPIIATAELDEVRSTCALTGHVWDSYWPLDHKRTFEALPAELRAKVMQHMNQAGP